jgi:hypothetical protein
VDVKKIVLLGLAAVALILGGLGIVLARTGPFPRNALRSRCNPLFLQV